MSFNDYLIKKAAAGEYAKDFMAGMDPFGAWTSGYGQKAERAGVTEKKHRTKQLLATAGGLVGGGLAVPAGIGGVTGGVSSALGAKGGAKARAAAGLAGAAKGALEPFTGLHRAMKAKKVTRRMAESGNIPSNLTDDEMKSLKYVAENTPIGALSGLAKGRGDELAMLSSIAKGEKGWDDVLQAAQSQVPGAREYANQVRERVEGEASQFVQEELAKLDLSDLEPYLDLQATPGNVMFFLKDAPPDVVAAFKKNKGKLDGLRDRVNMRAKDVWERELEGGSNPRFQEARQALRDARGEALRTVDKQLGTAVGTGQAALGMSAGVGGAGAFVQYGKGRATEQDFRGRMGSPGPLRLSMRNDPMQKSASKRAFLTAILAPTAAGGAVGFAAGRRRKTKTTYVDLPGKLPKGKGKTRKVKVAYVQRDFIKEAHALLDDSADGAWPFFFGELEKLARSGKAGSAVENLMARVRARASAPRPKKKGSGKVRKKLDEIKAQNAKRPKPLTDEMREAEGSTKAVVRRKRKANVAAKAYRDTPTVPLDIGPTLSAVPEVPPGLGLDSVVPQGGRMGEAPTLVRPAPQVAPPPAQVPPGPTVSPAGGRIGNAPTLVQPRPAPAPAPQPTPAPAPVPAHRADQPPPVQPGAQPQQGAPQLPAVIPKTQPGAPQPGAPQQPQQSWVPDWYMSMTPERKAMMAGAMGVGGFGAGLAAGSGR